MSKTILITILFLLGITLSIFCYKYQLELINMEIKLHSKENIITSLEREANYYKNEYNRIVTEVVDKQNYEVE